MAPLAALIATFATTAFAATGPPLQADLSLLMPSARGESRQIAVNLDRGDARVAVRAMNGRADADTVRVTLRFAYHVAPDTIALDEIIDSIDVQTSDNATGTISRASIDPNDMHLNPNRSRLVYQLTLYRRDTEYQVRVRVYGNYE